MWGLTSIHMIACGYWHDRTSPCSRKERYCMSHLYFEYYMSVMLSDVLPCLNSMVCHSRANGQYYSISNSLKAGI